MIMIKLHEQRQIESVATVTIFIMIINFIKQEVRNDN
jgi:hypothetical protein